MTPPIGRGSNWGATYPPRRLRTVLGPRPAAVRARWSAENTSSLRRMMWADGVQSTSKVWNSDRSAVISSAVLNRSSATPSGFPVRRRTSEMLSFLIRRCSTPWARATLSPAKRAAYSPWVGDGTSPSARERDSISDRAGLRSTIPPPANVRSLPSGPFSVRLGLREASVSRW